MSPARNVRELSGRLPAVVIQAELPPPLPSAAVGQTSPALAKVVAMLRGREAVALREILDRPLSQRR